MISPILNTGLQGVQKGIEGAEEAASRIVKAGTVESAPASDASVVEPMVDLKLYERSVEASAKVVKTADEVLGTILDTLA